MRKQDLFGPQEYVHKFALAVATAATELEEVAFRAPFNLTVDAVRLIPTTAIVGNATNYVGVGVQNKGAAGTGTTVVAQKDFDTVTDDDVAAFDESAVTLSATAANLNVDAGEVLSADVTKGGTGEALDGILVIEYHPRGQ